MNCNDSKEKVINKTIKDRCYSKFEAKTMKTQTECNLVVKRKRGRPSGANSVTRKQRNSKTEADDYKSSKKTINSNNDSLNKNESVAKSNLIVASLPTSTSISNPCIAKTPNACNGDACNDNNHLITNHEQSQQENGLENTQPQHQRMDQQLRANHDELDKLSVKTNEVMCVLLCLAVTF